MGVKNMPENRVFIIEDNLKFAERIRNIIKTDFEVRKENGQSVHFSGIDIISKDFKSWVGLYKKDKDVSHLFLLDVSLDNSITGFQIAKQIRKNDPDSQIIFLTSHIELMGQVFVHNLKALSFVHKHDPLMEQRLTSAMDQMFHEWRLRQTELIDNRIQLNFGGEKHGDVSHLKYQYKNVHYRIEHNDIYSIETDTFRRRLVIKTDNGVYPCQRKLGEIENRLPQTFMRIHRSIIVNLNKIERLHSIEEQYIVVLKNGSEFPVSRTYTSGILEFLRD